MYDNLSGEHHSLITPQLCAVESRSARRAMISPQAPKKHVGETFLHLVILRESLSCALSSSASGQSCFAMWSVTRLWFDFYDKMSYLQQTHPQRPSVDSRAVLQTVVRLRQMPRRNAGPPTAKDNRDCVCLSAKKRFAKTCPATRRATSIVPTVIITTSSMPRHHSPWLVSRVRMHGWTRGAFRLRLRVFSDALFAGCSRTRSTRHRAD